MDGHFTSQWTVHTSHFTSQCKAHRGLEVDFRCKLVLLKKIVLYVISKTPATSLQRLDSLTTDPYFSLSASNMLMSFSNNENFTFPWWMIYHGAARGPDWLVKSPVGTNNYQATVSPHVTWRHTLGLHHHTWHHMTSYDITWQQMNLHVSWRLRLHFGL